MKWSLQPLSIVLRGAYSELLLIVIATLLPYIFQMYSIVIF